MSENTQEDVFEKPTATEKKKIRESLVLSSIISVFIDNYNEIPTSVKAPEGFSDKLCSFIESQDEQLLKTILLETIKKQITKLNKML